MGHSLAHLRCHDSGGLLLRGGLPQCQLPESVVGSTCNRFKGNMELQVINLSQEIDPEAVHPKDSLTASQADCKSRSINRPMDASRLVADKSTWHTTTIQKPS